MSVFEIPKANLTPSTRNFAIPPTILSDYENYLYTDVPHAVFDFTILRSWNDQFKEDYAPTVIRAEYFPINWKSKVGNSDANKNFYTDFNTTILKGDMAVREDGLIVMLNWTIQQYINAQTTQAIECNHYITIKRHVDAKADDRGYLVEAAHDDIIVNHLPCVMSEYAGRPDFSLGQDMPGIHADMLTTISMQWNEETKNVQIGDTFEWSKFTYRVINISHAEVNIDKTHGIITMNARRIAGGTLAD